MTKGQGFLHINTRIRENAEDLTAALQSHMKSVFSPDAKKELRVFSAGEAADLLGISTSFLRKLHFDEKIPDVDSTIRQDQRHLSAWPPPWRQGAGLVVPELQRWLRQDDICRPHIAAFGAQGLPCPCR